MGLTDEQVAEYNNLGGGMPSSPAFGDALQKLGFNSQRQTLPSGGTPDVDFAAAEIYAGTLTTNTVLALSNPELDKVILLIVDGTSHSHCLEQSRF